MKSFLYITSSWSVLLAPLAVQGADKAWSATPGNGSFSGANWTAGQIPGAAGTNVLTTDALFFGTSSITSLTNDNTGFAYNGFTYQSGAPAFTIGGNAFTLGGDITNNGTAAQVINNAITLSANRTVFTNAGDITLGPVSGGSFNLNKAGASNLTLSGANTMNGFILRGGTTAVGNGSTLTTTAFSDVGFASPDFATLNVTGTGSILVGGDFNISDSTGSNGILNVAGTGLVRGNVNYVGKTGNATGVVNITGGGAFASVTGDFRVGGGGSASDATTVGIVNLSNGTLTSAGNFQAGAFGRGQVNQTGGTANLANFPAVGRFATGVGTYDLSGGNANQTGAANFFIVGEDGSGVLNVRGAGVLTLSSTNASTALAIGLAAGGNGSVNLLGSGRINTLSVGKGAGTGTFNFNGGTLQARGANTTFMQGLNNAFVYAGGASIDSNNFAITIAQPLLAPTGSGVNNITFTTGGSGFTAPPIVQITGGGGTGATAIANINGSGVLTGFTITNPGVGYTSVPTVSLINAALATGGALPTGVSSIIAANTSGGLTKTGAGMLTLTGNSSYTGVTTVNGGTLQFGVGGSLYNNGANPGSVVVNNTGELAFGRNDTFGNDGTVTPVTVTINTGGLVTSNGLYTTLPNVTLNGGELRANGGVNGSFPAYQLRNVTVGGSAASTISSTVAPNSFIALGQTGGSIVPFNVADATGNANADLTVSAALVNSAGGASGLTKSGAGTMVLTAANTYTGATNITGGSLIVSGAGNIASSSVVTVSAGTLGGNGTVADITLNSGGTVAPGNSIGTLLAESLTWNTGGVMAFELGASTVSDLLDLDNTPPGGSGAFTKGVGTVFTFDFLGTGTGTGAVPSFYTLVDYASTTFNIADFNYINLPGNGTFQFVGTTLQLTVTPEPGRAALLGLGALLLLGHRRRIKQSGVLASCTPANLLGSISRLNHPNQMTKETRP